MQITDQVRMDTEYVLELEHLRKDYPNSTVLKDFSVQLKRGEILGIVGENGAGKSTLVKCCSGAIDATSGIIRINGKVCSGLTPKKASELGIAVIYQEFTNVPELNVAENIFLGHPIKKGILVDKKAMAKEAREIFDLLKVEVDPMEKVKNLSVGYQQMVEIAKAIRQNAQILFMDEPSAPLSNNEVDNLFRIVRLLRERGVTIIYISHRLNEILQLTDRVAVLRDGDHIDTLKTSETSIEQMIAGVPICAILMAACVFIGWFILNQTYFGRYIFAIGGNEEASHLSGISVNKMKYFAYIFSALFAGLVGIVLLSRSGSAQTTVGKGFEFDVITCVVLGGVSVKGGVGRISGVIAGTLIIGALTNGMILLNICEYMQMVIKGLVLAVAVAFDCLSASKRAQIR